LSVLPVAAQQYQLFYSVVGPRIPDITDSLPCRCNVNPPSVSLVSPDQTRTVAQFFSS